MPSSQLDVQKRQHRERGQPANRKRFGLLEKHKDYVQRARDYHSKQDRIKTLQEKAELRNKDEFYFGMVKSRTKGGVHIKASDNEALPTDLVKLLKTQDVKYVQVQRVAERKRIEKLQEQLHSLLPADESRGEGASRGKRTIFTDDVSTLRSSEPLKRLIKDKGKGKESNHLSPEAATHLERLQAELAARQEREQTLARAERELELQRLLMGKGAKRDLLGKRKRKDDTQGRTGGDDESDEEFRGEIKASKLPKPEEGVKTKARVWKWRAERKR